MQVWGPIAVLALISLTAFADINPSTNSTDSAAVFPSRKYMQKFEVAHIDDKAVCNDGSPGVYYYRPGTQLQSTRWVIRFLGGAWCWDRGSCQARSKEAPHLMTSTIALPPKVSADDGSIVRNTGITSIDPELNPTYYSQAHVLIWYCSSDLHLADIAPGAGSEFGEWQFRGKRIAAAVLEDLFLQHGLGNATQVLLTGDSAGGVGAMNNADWIGSVLRKSALRLENYKAFIDGGWFLDIALYNITFNGFSFQRTARALAGPLNATFDRTCMDHYGADESWRCFFAASCFAHLETPALFQEYLYDYANLNYDGAVASQYEDFRRKLTASLRGVPAACWNMSSGNCTSGAACSDTPAWPSAKLAEAAANLTGAHDTRSATRCDSSAGGGARPNVFAPACNAHQTVDGELFSKVSIGEVSLVEVLDVWYKGGAQEIFDLDRYERIRSGFVCGTDPQAPKQFLASIASHVPQAWRSL